MGRVFEFVKTTLIGGVIFLLPLVLIVVLVQHGLKLAAKFLEPITSLLPEESLFGFGMKDVIAIAFLLGAGFLAGLIARTKLGSALERRTESLILRKMPGFMLIKGAAQGLANMRTDDSTIRPALARLDDAWLLAFIVEEHASGLLTVFVPSAPTPAAGTIYYLEESQVKRLDVPLADAVKCVMQLGVGSKEMLETKLLAASARDGASRTQAAE